MDDLTRKKVENYLKRIAITGLAVASLNLTSCEYIANKYGSVWKGGEANKPMSALKDNDASHTLRNLNEQDLVDYITSKYNEDDISSETQEERSETREPEEIVPIESTPISPSPAPETKREEVEPGLADETSEPEPVESETEQVETEPVEITVDTESPEPVIETSNEVETIGDETKLEESIESETVETSETTDVETDEPIENPLNKTSENNTKYDKCPPGKVAYNNTGVFKLSKETEDKITEYAKSSGKLVSFYITDPKTNSTISFNGERNMHPASTIKLGMCLAVCKAIDRGEISFEDKMTYQEKYYCGGSGTIQNRAFGEEFTVRQLLERCIHISDNVAYYMLMDKVGKRNYNEMVLDLGCDNYLAGGSKWGYINAHDLNLIMQEVYANGRDEGKEIYELKKAGKQVDESNYSACGILNFELLDAEFDFIEANFPYKDVAHKSGFNDKTRADNGIITTEYGDLLLTMMIQTGNAKDFKSFSKVINEAINEYVDFKQNESLKSADAETELEK